MPSISEPARKHYEKPAVISIDLAVKEVLGGCKTDATVSGAGGGAPINCVTLNCVGDNKPS